MMTEGVEDDAFFQCTPEIEIACSPPPHISLYVFMMWRLDISADLSLCLLTSSSAEVQKQRVIIVLCQFRS
jgi:hypothetical protein